MKVAWVVPGGVDRSGTKRIIPVLLWLAERIASRHDLTIVALNQYAEPCSYELAGARVHNIGGSAGVRQLVRATRTLVGLGPFDITHGFWLGSPALTASLAARRLDCPSVATVAGGELVAIDDIDYGGQRRAANRVLVGRSLRLASEITVASGPIEALVRRHGFSATHVPLGVDRRWFTPPALPPAAPPWRLLHVGSLNPVKDQTTLLRAFAVVRARRSDVELDIVGEDTSGGALQRHAAELGLESRVRFHDALPTGELGALYRRAHLFLLSSRHESGPLVVLEAAACGVMTVGTAVGHVADWSPDRATAVEVGDAAGLAGAVLAALADAPRRERIATAARQWAEQHDADWTALEFERLYDSARRRHA